MDHHPCDAELLDLDNRLCEREVRPGHRHLPAQVKVLGLKVLRHVHRLERRRERVKVEREGGVRLELKRAERGRVQHDAGDQLRNETVPAHRACGAAAFGSGLQLANAEAVGTLG